MRKNVWHALPVTDRKNYMQQMIKRHEANKKMYNFIMRRY